MSAHAYIKYDGVPDTLLEAANRYRDGEAGARRLIEFENIPVTGEISETSEGITQIEFVWPRNIELRHALGDWFTHHGINFTVVM